MLFIVCALALALKPDKDARKPGRELVEVVEVEPEGAPRASTPRAEPSKHVQAAARTGQVDNRGEGFALLREVSARDLAWSLPLADTGLRGTEDRFAVQDHACSGASVPVASALVLAETQWSFRFELAPGAYPLFAGLKRPVLCQGQEPIANLVLTDAYGFPHHLVAAHLRGVDGYRLPWVLELGVCALVGLALVSALVVAGLVVAKGKEQQPGLLRALWLLGGLLVLSLVLGYWLLSVAGRVQTWLVAVCVLALAAVLACGLHLCYALVLRRSLQQPFKAHGVAIVFTASPGPAPQTLKAVLLLAAAAFTCVAVDAASTDAQFGKGPFLGRLVAQATPPLLGLALLALLCVDEVRAVTRQPKEGEPVYAEQVVGASRQLHKVGADLTVEQVLRVAAELAPRMCEHLEAAEGELEIMDEQEERREHVHAKQKRIERNQTIAHRNQLAREQNAQLAARFRKQRQVLLQKTAQEDPMVCPELTSLEYADAAWVFPDAKAHVVAQGLLAATLCLVLAAALAALVAACAAPALSHAAVAGRLSFPLHARANTLYRAQEPQLQLAPGPIRSLEVLHDGTPLELVAAQGSLKVPIPAGPAPSVLTIKAAGLWQTEYALTVVTLAPLAFVGLEGEDWQECVPLNAVEPQANVRYLPEEAVSTPTKVTLSALSLPFGLPFEGAKPVEGVCGTCPNCALLAANGDQCSWLQPADKTSFCARKGPTTACKDCPMLTMTGLEREKMIPGAQSGGVRQYREVGRLHFANGQGRITAALGGAWGTRALDLRTGVPELKVGLAVGQTLFPQVALADGGLCAGPLAGADALVQWEPGADVQLLKDGQPVSLSGEDVARATSGGLRLPWDGAQAELALQSSDPRRAQTSAPRRLALALSPAAACVSQGLGLLQDHPAEAAELLGGSLVKALELPALPPSTLYLVATRLSPYVEKVSLPDGFANLAEVPDGVRAAKALAQRGITKVDLSKQDVTEALDLPVEELVLREARIAASSWPSKAMWRSVDLTGATFDGNPAPLFAGALDKLVLDRCPDAIKSLGAPVVGSLSALDAGDVDVASLWERVKPGGDLLLRGALKDDQVFRLKALCGKDCVLPSLGSLSLRDAELSAAGLASLADAVLRAGVGRLDLRGSAVPEDVAAKLRASPHLTLELDDASTQLEPPALPVRAPASPETPITAPASPETPITAPASPEASGQGGPPAVAIAPAQATLEATSSNDVAPKATLFKAAAH